ncbi:MAG: hypothetical protein QXI77_01920 [Nanopusillaceae archaeon]
MVITKPAKIQITKKLEDILNTFNKEIFNKDKKIFVGTIDLGYDERTFIFENAITPAFYININKKIYIESNYLDFILNNYKNNPELIKELIGNLLHENIHAILDTNLKKENIAIYEGLATLVGDLCKTIVSEYKIDTNNSLEEILEKIGKYVIEKFKNKEYLRNLEEKLREEFEKERIIVLLEILKRYDRCIDIPYTSSEILKLKQEIEYYVLYKTPSLILQKNPGILKILEDLSSKEFPIDKYKEIIFEEYKNLEGKDLITNTLECIIYKSSKHNFCYRLLGKLLLSRLSKLKEMLSN